MAFFDKLGNTISAAGKTGLSKAKEIKDTARIALEIGRASCRERV